MKTRTYLLLFIAASLAVIVGVYFKIEEISGSNYILGVALLVQAALIVGYLLQKSTGSLK